MTYEQFKEHVDRRLETLRGRDKVDYFYVDPDYYDDFTWRDCSVCLQTSAGSRYRLIGMRPDLETVEYIICEDCMQLLEFGCIDDYHEA